MRKIIHSAETLMANTVLITGASTGIGRATAEYFHEHGWTVVATMRKPAGGSARTRWIELPLDVTDPSSVGAAITRARELCGRLDVLVNNAGYGLVGTFESIEDDAIRRQFETNVFGLMRVTRAVLPWMREMRAGTIVNVSSMGARVTFPYYSVYHATKWAVDGFSEALRYELDPLGIRVRIVEPGAVKTDFYGRSEEFVHDRQLAAYNARVDRVRARMASVGRHGSTPESVAKIIYAAATATGNQLRYAAGLDAKALLALRHLIGAQLFQRIVNLQLAR
jgi:NAD(P)-dependent dehydrogenase (short-subunit alcohol dehydrogenase family)